MAGNAKFQIDIYGNTIQFENSLKGIDNAMSSLKGEAAQLRKELRFDPTNVTAMTKLQANYKQQLEQTRNKATALKKELVNVDSSTPDGAKKFVQLSKAIQDSELKASYLEKDIKQLDSSIASGNFKVDLKTEDAEGKMNKMKSSFNAFKEVAIGALREVGSTIVNKLGSSIGSAVERFDTLERFPRLMQQMGYSSDDVTKSVNTLKTGVDGLPTSLQDLTKSAQTFSILEKSASKGADTAVALNDAFLASSASSEDASRGVEQYSQMLASGTVDLQSWRTLQETMPYALTKVANAFGLTGKSAERDLYQKLKDGEITMDELNAKFVELDKGTGGFAETARTASGGIGTSFKNLNNSITNGLANTIKETDTIIKDATGKGIAEHLDGLKENIKSVFASVNEALQEALPSIISAISDVVSALQDFGKWLSGDSLGAEVLRGVLVALLAGFVAFKTITTVIAIFNGLKSAITTARIAMMLFNSALLTNPITAIIVAISALVAGLVYFFTQTKTGKALWQSFMTWFQGAWEGIKTFFAGLGTWFGQLWKGIVDVAITTWDGIKSFFSGLGTFFKQLWAGIGTLITTIWDGIKAYFSTLITFYSTIFNAIVTVVSTVFTAIGNFALTAFNAIVSFFTPLGQVIGTIFDLVIAVFQLGWELILALGRGAWQGIQAIWNGLVGFFTPIWNTVSNVVSTVFSAIGNFAKSAWSVIVSVFSVVAGWFSGIWNAVSNIVNVVFTAIGNFARTAWSIIQSVISVVGGWFGNIFNSVRNAVANVFNAFGGIASGAWGAIRGVFSGVAGWFGGIFNGIKGTISGVFNAFGSIAQSGYNAITGVFNGIGSFFSGIFDGIKNTVDNVLGGVSNTIKGITDTINGITGKVKGLFKGSTVTVAKEFADLKARGLVQNSASSSTSNYKNTFNIQAGNQDTTALARAIKREFDLGRA